jgi:hypothetical protein
MYCRRNMVQFAFVLFVLVATFDLAAVFMFGARYIMCVYIYIPISIHIYIHEYMNT